MSAPQRSGKGGGGKSFGNIGLFPILLIGGILFFGYRKLKLRRADSDRFREVRETAREDLVALADDVQGLEQKVESNEPAKRDYLAALEQYSRASDAFDRARTPAQLAPVAEALEEGRYLMASAEARLEGKEPPERRPAVLLRPAPRPVRPRRRVDAAGRPPRQVPACAADARAGRGRRGARVAAGASPAAS